MTQAHVRHLPRIAAAQSERQKKLLPHGLMKEIWYIECGIFQYF